MLYTIDLFEASIEGNTPNYKAVIFYYENAWPRAARLVQNFLEKRGWIV